MVLNKNKTKKEKTFQLFNRFCTYVQFLLVILGGGGGCILDHALEDKKKSFVNPKLLSILNLRDR